MRIHVILLGIGIDQVKDRIVRVATVFTNCYNLGKTIF